MKIEMLQSSVRTALSMLVKHDYYLLEHNLFEPCITHKLAVHFENLFPHWHVDAEFDKDREGAKQTYIDPPSEEQKAAAKEEGETATAIPDVIVHHRGTDNNLLIVEVKKQGEGLAYDRLKLHCYTSQRALEASYLGYSLGVLIIMRVGDDSGKMRLQWFIGGDPLPDEEILNLQGVVGEDNA